MERRAELNTDKSISDVVALGCFAARFALVERATQKVDGTKENDTEHSYMLGLIAVHLATKFYPDLDTGLVVKFALIHDAPEVIVGDTPTFAITAEQRAAKESAEEAAAKELIASLQKPWGELLERYEQQEEREARFVRLVDKMMPALMHIHGDGRATFKDSYGIKTEEQFWAARDNRAQELRDQYPEFPEIHDVLEEVVLHAAEVMWSTDY